jgi:hypothetical protein
MAMPPQFERFQFPVATFDGLFNFYGWNITIPLVEFKPRPRGLPNANFADQLLIAQPTDPARIANAESFPDGYRLLCWPHNRRWYEALRQDGQTYLYSETDLYQMFYHVSAPA